MDAYVSTDVEACVFMGSWLAFAEQAKGVIAASTAEQHFRVESVSQRTGGAAPSTGVASDASAKSATPNRRADEKPNLISSR